MARMWIVVGDTTTGGGTVVSGSSYSDVGGKPVARVGDKVVCKRHGPTSIVSGDASLIVDGQPVAREQDSCGCGCKLVSISQQSAFIDAGGGTAAAAAVILPALVAESSSQGFDEQIHFVNALGANLAGVSYLLHLDNGQTIRGVTDGEGKTRRITTTQAQAVSKAELSAQQSPCCPVHSEMSQGGARPSIEVPTSGVSTNPTDLGSSVKQVQTPKGESRGLTSGEIAMAKQVFGEAIDYSRVKVHNGEYLWFGMQPDNTAMTPNGEMYFNPTHFREDFSTESPGIKVWFMHEMTHVWQYQLGYPVKWRGALRIGLSYEYEADANKRLGDYNMESQGDIVADYFALKFLRNRYAVRQDRYKKPEVLPILESMLQDFLKNPKDKGSLP